MEVDVGWFETIWSRLKSTLRYQVQTSYYVCKTDTSSYFSLIDIRPDLLNKLYKLSRKYLTGQRR